MKLIKFIGLSLTLAATLYLAGCIGYGLSTYNTLKEHTSDWLEISDNLNTYYIHNSATVHISEIYEDNTLRYDIQIEDVRGSFTIVYTDQIIDGEFVSAKMWLDSFIMAMEGFKNAK